LLSLTPEGASLEWGIVAKWVGVFLLGAGGGYLKDVVLWLLRNRSERRGERERDAGIVRAKEIEAEPVLLASALNRLQQIEEREEKCQAEVFQLKSDLQTTWLGIEMILMKCPEADDDVRAAIKRMRKRQGEFLHDEPESKP
jgi:hypothetical protein